MRTLDPYTFVHDACMQIRNQAERGVWDGKGFTRYFNECRWQLFGQDCIVIFTKETGYHSGGWWKNPEYERCYHLSISFPGGKNQLNLTKILDQLFGMHTKKLWVEPPFSPKGKANDVWHYRLFCDEHWNPIKPKGEVYSTQFTEKGWKSFSELHDKK